MSAASSSSPSAHDELKITSSSEELDGDLRALRALRLLLESRMIDRTEYERRLASFKRRVELGSGKLENDLPAR